MSGSLPVLRPRRAAFALEPVVANTSAVARQIFKGVQTVEVVDGNPCDGLGLGETQVDSNVAASGLVLILRPPEGDTPAVWAEVELDHLTTDIGPGTA